MIEAPNWPSLDEVPAHPTLPSERDPRGGEGFWIACEYPERPHTDDTVYDWRCYACFRAAEADLRVNGDRQLLSYGQDGIDTDAPMMSEALARSAAFLGVDVSPKA